MNYTRTKTLLFGYVLENRVGQKIHITTWDLERMQNIDRLAVSTECYLYQLLSV